MNLTRLDIYKRFYWICRTHTAAQSYQHANAFFVGQPYELNTNNLWKGDSQAGVYQKPEYFWSRRWEEYGFAQNQICKDFPLVMLSPGSRSLTNSKVGFNYTKSNFNFDISVFDTQNRDRNNLGGNKSAIRECETIWHDTELILIEIMTAFKGRDPNAIYNLLIAGEALSLPSDPSTWDPSEQAQAAAWLKTYLLRINWDVSIQSDIAPFKNHTSDLLAGVDLSISFPIDHDCIDGNYEYRPCP
jgi:hypothetical protein